MREKNKTRDELERKSGGRRREGEVDVKERERDEPCLSFKGPGSEY